MHHPICDILYWFCKVAQLHERYVFSDFMCCSNGANDRGTDQGLPPLLQPAAEVSYAR